jgi:multidrug transporter EmrE-like cation transporter
VTAGTLILILVSVSLSALAQIAFKLGVTGRRSAGVVDGSMVERLLHAVLTPGVLTGLALYGFGTLLWLTALGRVEVSQAYPFVGLGFVLTALLGYAFFGDALSPQRIAGILVVIGGVALVAQS